MNTDFTKFMAKRDDEELIRIVTFDKNDYQPSALTAARKELKKRNIDPKRLKKLTKRLKEIIEAEKEEEKPRSIWEQLGRILLQLILLPFILLVCLPLWLLQKLKLIPVFGDDNTDDDEMED